MEKSKKDLKILDLEDKEIIIIQTLKDFGQLRPTDLAQKTGVKRTTVNFLLIKFSLPFSDRLTKSNSDISSVLMIYSEFIELFLYDIPFLKKHSCRIFNYCFGSLFRKSLASYRMIESTN